MKHDSWMDNLRELVSGGNIMLFIFGLTICFMASTSLIAIIFDNHAEKLSLFKEVLVALIGYISGAYSTMWNNQNFKTTQKTNGVETTKEAKDV